MNIAMSLKSMRNEKNLTVLELSQKLNIKHQNIYRWENDTVLPSISQLLILADFYNTSIDYLIGRADDNNNVQIQNDMTRAEKELLSAYRNNDMEGRALIYGYAMGVAEKRKNKSTI